MKILYIPTVNNSLYHYFDYAIINGLLQINHQVRTYSDYTNIDTLNTIVSSFQPDIILTMAQFNIRFSFLNWIKEQKCATAIWLTEDPYYTDKTVKIIDYFKYIFTIESSCVPLYKNYGHHHVYHLPLGTDPAIYSPSQTNTKDNYDLSLVGFPYPERVEIIKFLLQKERYSILLVGSNWKTSLTNDKPLPHVKILNNWIDPFTVASIYNQSKIILNPHRSHMFKYNRNKMKVLNQSLNNRTFDIASCGAFQLIDKKVDLTKHFIEGKEMISFTSKENLIESVEFFLKHARDRKLIAENARKKVLSNDTFHHRMQEVLSIINTA